MRAQRGNLAAEFFAIWPEPTAWKGRFAHRTLTLIDAVHQQVRRHPDESNDYFFWPRPEIGLSKVG